MRPTLGLAEVSSSSLQRLLDGLGSGRLRAPIERAKLAAFGVHEQLPALLSVFESCSSVACSRIIESVLAERDNVGPRPELVWTGPEGPTAKARDTAVVLRELFKTARQHVILAGYSFTRADNVLRPLYDVMASHGVEATFFVNIEQAKTSTESGETYGQEALDSFFRSNWPFGAPFPALYCDRRALELSPRCSLHAKCVTVDGERAFLSSANFTTSGQRFNIETGILIEDSSFVEELEHQWLTLIRENLVYRRSL